MKLAGILGTLFGLLLLVPLIVPSIWLYSTLNAPVWVWVCWAVGVGGTTLLSFLNAFIKVTE